MIHLALALLASAACAPVQSAERASAGATEPIPVLVVSGANNHDWEFTAPSLAGMLEETGRFDVTITTAPAQTLADAEALAGYRAVVLDYNGPAWGAEAERTFLEAVDGGLGVAVIHAANNAFPGWKAYEAMVGLLWRQGTGHGRFHPFDVSVLDRNHPITATLPRLVAHPDELYHGLVNPRGVDVRVLGRAHSSRETGGTGADEPVIIVSRFGQGRVFHTPLGHVWPNAPDTRASHADPQFRRLVARGVEWAATGSVTDGPPAAATGDGADGGAWRSLFDGRSPRGWLARGSGPGWTIESGALVRTAAPDREVELHTVQGFDAFELELEWQVGAGGEGAVRYRVPARPPAEGQASPPELAYLLCDDTRRAEGAPAGSLVGGAEAEPTEAGPAFFHAARIRVQGGRIEHRLDGRRVLETALPEGSRPGAIALVASAGEVWFRAIRIRELPPR